MKVILTLVRDCLLLTAFCNYNISTRDLDST